MPSIAEQDSLDALVAVERDPADGRRVILHFSESVEDEKVQAIRAAADTLSQMRDALEVCRDKFAEYVRLHKAKLHDGTPTQEWLSIREKVTRNEDMVRLCDAALTTTKKEKDPAR